MTAEPAIPESGPRRHGVRLTPLQVPKSSDVLADDLRERILRGDFPEGTALPTERELVSQTRMSRATVREALRILEVQGLVRVKTGRAGGAYVYRPGRDSMADSVQLLIRARKIRIPALLAAVAARLFSLIWRQSASVSEVSPANVPGPASIWPPSIAIV